MNKIYFLCIIGLFTASLQTSAQFDSLASVSKHTVDASGYIRKSKNQKTAARILLAGGVGLTAAGLVIVTIDAFRDIGVALTPIFTMGTFYSEKTPHRASGPNLIIAGTAAMLGSVPLFILSKKNTRKAAITFSNEYTGRSLDGKIVHHRTPSLKLSISIR
ncbi:MAG TPA: hypothetical protein VLJ41_06395 [Segetibacter sp.]|nr:hypothetical protein [Segetibacter sp.]